MEKILVLMSTYNGEKYLDEQIKSIMEQEKVDVHLLVRDDGSKDSTREIVNRYIQTYPGKIELEAGTNLGFAKSFMTLVYMGYERKEYNYFAFSDQDDIWLKDKLSAAVSHLQTLDETKPGLYFADALAVDENMNELMHCCGENPLITKETSLVRYFMLGCTMAFNRATAEVLYIHRPESKILMHDLWLNQTCVFLGNVVYDKQYHILYRQHSNNTAGVGNNWGKRWHRLVKSFKTYERRHFRELNAQNILSAYGDVLTQEDKALVSCVADYRKSIPNRFRLMSNNHIINMGSTLSNTVLKVRALLGFF